MQSHGVSRRTLLKGGGAVFTGATVLRLTGPAAAFQENPAAEVIPWADVLAENPVPEVIVQQLDWESLDSWITPNEDFFVIKHFAEPTIDEASWTLKVSGLVSNPLSLSLSDLLTKTRAETTFTMECSGNTGLPFFNGGIGNATWAGMSLAELLTEADISEDATEVVFWGADAGEQVWRDATITEHFARSMSVADAMNPENLIALEMNGEPLPPLHGFPARLIAPGWYGVANVKWLTRIEVINHRYQGNFMAREYVTIREEEQDGESVWTFTSVGPGRLKSAPAKVLKDGDSYSVMGAAWGGQIASVDVKIDDGDWQPAELSNEGDGSDTTWTFWNYEWGTPEAGEHTVTSRATDADGHVQPAPDDPMLATKVTYWESNGQITRTVEID